MLVERTPGTVGILVVDPGFSDGAFEEAEKNPQFEIILSYKNSIVSDIKRIVEAKKNATITENQQLVEARREYQQLILDVVEIRLEVQRLRSDIDDLWQLFLLLILVISMLLYMSYVNPIITM